MGGADGLKGRWEYGRLVFSLHVVSLLKKIHDLRIKV